MYCIIACNICIVQDKPTYLQEQSNDGDVGSGVQLQQTSILPQPDATPDQNAFQEKDPLPHLRQPDATPGQNAFQEKDPLPHLRQVCTIHRGYDTIRCNIFISKIFISKIKNKKN